MMKNNPNLEILVGARKKLGKTQKQVAEETGVKQQFVSAWENGTTLIPKSKAELVANAYGLKLETIALLIESETITIRVSESTANDILPLIKAIASAEKLEKLTLQQFASLVELQTTHSRPIPTTFIDELVRWQNWK